MVSIVMSSYNHEKYISEAIESVLNQTFGDFELIVVDDCSGDNSKEIIADYQAKDERILAIFHKENCGIPKTLNEGMSRSSGRFISFINSDDAWVSSKLEKQLGVLKYNGDLIVWCEGEIIDRKSKPTGMTFTQLNGSQERKKSGDIFEELMYGNYVFLSSVIFSAENVRDIKFDEHLKYLNDYKFMVDLARKCKYYFIKEPLAKYRIHGTNTIFSDRLEWEKDSIKIGKYLKEKYGDQIPKKTKANVLSGIGLAYSRLGEKVTARRFIFEAISLNIIHKRNLAWLAETTANEGSFMGKTLIKIYKAVNSHLIRIRKRLVRALVSENPDY
jgi:glycosyltransferase involved in cell wall biosynthesis